jgi:hypothetical protein
VAQNGMCGICEERFTDYSDVVPDHISPRGLGAPGGMITPTIFKLSTGGATAKRAPHVPDPRD